MAATRKRTKRRASRAQNSALKALSLAALALPGLMLNSAWAQEADGIDVQVTHFAEGERDILGVDYNSFADAIDLPQGFEPIEAETLFVRSRFNVGGRFRAFVNYTHDTWSGATAVATAYAAQGANAASAGRHAADGVTITGASPILGISANLIPMQFDRSLSNGYSLLTGAIDNRRTLVMSSASPETREQIDAKLRYAWNEAALDVGGGVSDERDYRSVFGNIGGRFDFNQRLTTLSWGVSYTESETHATLDPDGLPFFDIEHYTPGLGSTAVLPATSGYVESIFGPSDPFNPTSVILHGDRRDWGAQLGLTQVLNKDAVATFDIGYTRSTGYLSNPYKTVLGHTVQFLPGVELGEEILHNGSGGAFLEVRPPERNLVTAHLGLAYYVEPFDAALHIDYSYAHDDWDIDAHTLRAEWAQPLGENWLVTPSVRYYSQSAAGFYTTGIFQTVDENRDIVLAYPQYFSSDTRLSAFGTLSGGLTVSNEIFEGVSVEASFEYFTHRGDLSLGGGGEEDFADYDYWTLGAALKLTPEAIAGRAGHGGHQGHNGHTEHRSHHAGTPAGVMLDHALAEAGDYMVGYTHTRGTQGGDILSGARAIDLSAVRTTGCNGAPCAVTPEQMNMHMHMLHLMYAPTDWLTLAIMPQWMDMGMSMAPNPDFLFTNPEGHAGHSTSHVHETGGIGDTGFYALIKLVDEPRHQVTLALGGTAPTGDVDITLRKTGANPVDDVYMHYGMQTGSGTWDFIPTLSYEGGADTLSWGAQATATIRSGRNDSGYALGDVFQASAWGGYRWSNFLTTSVRGIYTTQGSIEGAFPASAQIDPGTGLPFIQEHIGPFDQSGSYGGQFWDLGLGVNLTIPGGAFAGNTLKFEWVQPLRDDVNAFQLQREGTLFLSWSTSY
ncbi:MAG: DUF3570 domain-containing protein [Terricaulis sp.]